MRWGIALAVFLLAPWLAMADQNGAFNDGRSLGASLNQQNRDAITAGNIENKIPAYGQSVAEATYFQGGRGDTVVPGVARVSTCSSVTPDSDPIRRQECEAVNFLARNPDIRPQFSITGNDSMILGAKNARTNAESTFQSLGIAGGTGSSTQCQTRTETTPAQFTTETCSSPREVATEQCAMGRIINIDTDANYQCDRTATVLSTAIRAPSITTSSCTMGRIVDINSDSNFQCDQTTNAYETLKCRRGSIIACTGGGDGCDQGGIVPNSWAGDMSTSFTGDGAGNFILQFGTIADNYWGGWGAVYDRNLTFEIRDVGLISLFALTRAAFDDWLLVKINGTIVYVGPNGGDRLEIFSPPPVFESSSTRTCAPYWGEFSSGWQCLDVLSESGNLVWYQDCTLVGSGWNCTPTDYRTGMVTYCATCFSGPELSTSWNIGLNIDLKPFLRNGANTIFMRTIVAGGGEGAIQMTTRQLCPSQCSVSLTNQCAALEARASP